MEEELEGNLVPKGAHLAGMFPSVEHGPSVDHILHREKGLPLENSNGVGDQP